MNSNKLMTMIQSVFDTLVIQSLFSNVLIMHVEHCLGTLGHTHSTLRQKYMFHTVFPCLLSNRLLLKEDL